MKKPCYTDIKNGTRLEVYECNVGLVGKLFNNRTNVCTNSHVFRNVDYGGVVTISDIKTYFIFI
jgi:hypothetical protein